MRRSFRLLLPALALAAPLALAVFAGPAEARAPRGPVAETGEPAQPVASRRHETRRRQEANTRKHTQRQRAARERHAARPPADGRRLFHRPQAG